MSHAIPDRVVILGTGGFALELAQLMGDCGCQVVGFVGPRPDCPLPAPWLGGDDSLSTVSAHIPALVAAGQPHLRQRLLAMAAAQRPLARFVHPAALVSSAARIDDGCMVYPNSTIHAGVHLESGVLINSNVSVGHESKIGPCCNIGPGSSLGGRIRLGARVFIGIGASLIEKLDIADDTIIGAGAAVIRSIPTAGTWVGVPARPLEQRG